ncbi:MAG: carotenoid 1,2-hydratase [candidate division KSB1 bacterium]|nr:carotenoid 1,2-hydratase [candidate division KSB1 bacterium]MDZ7407013.1 carotenoid 1,2-hydratase [candidate division KSB1 bacterium]
MRYFAFFFLLFSFSAAATAQSDFAKVEKSWPWQFPRDHGRHHEFQTEWWYFTGNLRAENGRRFGYELTFFRQALAPSTPPRQSAWAFRDAYVAHFAITDIANERFYYDQKTARGALNLAGADSNKLMVHLGDWSARQDEPDADGKIAAGGKIHLRAASHFGKIDLMLTPTKPPVFHGDRGMLPNSALPGDAAYYYSLTSLQTEGTLIVDGGTWHVRGTSWMDHEFFSPATNPEIIGWDWLSLHLSDSASVMLANLRRVDGTNSPFSAGTLIQHNGSTQALSSRDFVLLPQAWWTSPASGGKYPIEWKIKFLDYELRLTTPVKNQELDTRRTTGKIYWEGYVETVGKKGQHAIGGEGYLEMTGYVK